MKPTLGQMLMGAASTLNDEIAPHIDDGAPVAIGHVGTLGLILACMAQEADRAVETAVREQDAIRALFADAAKAPLPRDLAIRLKAAAADDARPSLKLTDLEAQNAKLKRLLMTLLETLEAEHFDWAVALEARVWTILKTGAERRALYLPVL
ncbi:MAG TPA: hypothetical protein VG943_02470 [Caulobacterales bacterium]|nr:hypothetical protein [Caulobacterales bacterium]